MKVTLNPLKVTIQILEGKFWEVFYCMYHLEHKSRNAYKTNC